VVFDGATPVGRLVIGLAGLAVVLVGAWSRSRTPVLIGGGAVLVIALHELVVITRALPTWMPLTAAGVLVIALATTYERRRRDFRRLRGALGRMS
jgi:uncharacterized membrane protein